MTEMRAPDGTPGVKWEGYPHYRLTDARGRIWWAYGPSPGRGYFD